MNTPYDIPYSLRLALMKVEQDFPGLLQSNQLKKAQDLWVDLLQKYLKRQDDDQKRYHKGGIFHNLGIIAIHGKDLERAFKFFFLALAEDIASHVDLPDSSSPDTAPAAKTLLEFFRVSQEDYMKFKKNIEKNYKKTRFKNPVDVYMDFLITNIEESRIEEMDDDLSYIEPLYDINTVPGKHKKRVFVGGKYEDPSTITYIAKVVEAQGYVPIVASQCKMSKKDTHDLTLLLLHMCKYAIFEMSEDAGHLMEIERTFEYKTRVKLVYTEKPNLAITSMVKYLGKRYRLNLYRNKSELTSIIKSFLRNRK